MRLDVRMTDEAVVVLNRPVELKACARQILEPLGFVPELGGSFEQRSAPRSPTPPSRQSVGACALRNLLATSHEGLTAVACTRRMRKRAPLVRSSLALRGIATGVTLLSLAGMSAFASTHVQNAAAPLKPTVASTNQQASAATTTAATATPAPTSRTTRITARVTTTTQTARTRTASS